MVFAESENERRQLADEDTLVSAQSGPISLIRSSPRPHEQHQGIATKPKIDPRRSFMVMLRAIFMLCGRVFSWIGAGLEHVWYLPPLTAKLPPPPPLPGINSPLTNEQIAERLMHDLFLLPRSYAKAIKNIVDHAVYLQDFDEGARILALVHFAASRLAVNPLGFVAVALLEARLPHVNRTELHRALVGLHEDKLLELIDLAESAGLIAVGVETLDGKRLTHFKIRSPR